MELVDVLRFGIITVSDRCSAGEAEDTSGAHLVDLVKNPSIVPNGLVTERKTVPDDIPKIKEALLEMTSKCDVILTTGGTGFSPRDVTPEATKQIIDREAAGLSIAMMTSSLAITKMAMLSRGICGIRDQTVIVNLPGSKKSSQECFESIAMSIPHAVALLRGRIAQVESVHSQLHAHNSDKGSHCHHHHKNKTNHLSLHTHHVDSKVDVSQVARRARHSPYPCISVSEAVSKVLAHSAVLGTEVVDFREARGRILAQDVFALDALPPFPASIKDGYAVVAADGAGRRTVVGDSHAGKKPSEQSVLAPGSCVRINTGAPVPPGADAVVQVEDTTVLQEADDGRTELEVEILEAPVIGLDIRPSGSDIAVGQQVLSRGCLLGSSDLGLLATVGITSVLVHRVPTIAVLSTGNELQDPSLPLQPGSIRDSNKTILMALLQENGCPAVDVGIASDNPKAMLGKLREALAAGDIVVTTGSVSMGDKDILKQVITTDLGAKIHFGRVLMKPGKPATFATCEFNGANKLIFCLPGNPVSATVTCHLFVLPSVRLISGHAKPHTTELVAKLENGVELDPRPEYHRAVLTWSPSDPIPTASSTGNQISSRLLSFSSANCLLQFPSRTPEVPSLVAGSLVTALLLTRPN